MPRLSGDGGARGGARLLQLHGPQPSAGSPGAHGTGHLLRRSGDARSGAAPGAGDDRPGRGRGRRAAASGPGGSRSANPHVAHAGPLDGGPASPDLHRRSGALLPLRPLRCHAQPDLPPGGGPRRVGDDHPRGPEGHARRVRPRHLPGAAYTLPARLLPLHRAQRGGRRLLLPVRGHRRAPRRIAGLHLQGDGLDRDPRLGDGRPERLRLRQGKRLRPRACAGLRLRHGDRAHRDAQAWRPRPAQVLRERRPGAGAVSMKVPYAWLTEYCDPGLEAGELADRLAMRTTEVERVSHVGPPSPEGFVVGRVVSAGQHPNADRLSVCEVETGDGARTIVCGAPNVAAGQLVPVALPGATMPGGEKLGQAKLRGVVSDGMILSEAELGMGDDADGIAVLDGDAEPGTALADVLPVAEPVLELEVNSNRVDCFGVYGVAREVHAFTGAPLAPGPWEEDADATGEGQASDYASVTVEAPELCPRFTARVFTDVSIGPSPLWLKARLIAAGQRPINNVVDITNYVMLMTAQPLHAFDLDRVPDGALIVRTASDGEKMTTLDGTERTFDSQAVLVCDRNGPSGIAGIMGGQVSEVSDSTTRVLLEVATWNGVNILRTSRQLGLRSDASNRFEKQLHPELAIRAQRIASRLMIDLCGARLVPGTIDVAAEPPPPRRVPLRAGRAESLLGMAIEHEEQATYLERLGFQAEGSGDDIVAEVPAHRYYDVGREADLVEEVGRIHGYDEHLPATLPQAPGQGGRLTREQALRRRAEDVMRDLGFDGIVSLSLADPGLPGRLRLGADDARGAPVRVSNPLSLDHSELRTTLLGSLLGAARYNLARGADRVALWETGRGYLAHGQPQVGGVLGGAFAGERPPPAFEPQCIGALAVGPLSPPSWGSETRSADFFAIKGALEGLAGHLGVEVELEPEAQPFLHPGRSARIVVGGIEAGWLGEVHPLVCREWDLESAGAFQGRLAECIAASPYGREAYEDVTTYPGVYQDLPIVVPDDVPAAAVRRAVMEGGGELLRSASVFDLYRGEQVGEGRKSLALRLEFRAPDRTLTDAEVTKRRDAIKAALDGIGGSLRE